MTDVYEVRRRSHGQNSTENVLGMKSCHRAADAIRIWPGANKIRNLSRGRETLRLRGNIMRKCSFGFPLYGADRNSYRVYSPVRRESSVAINITRRVA